jgi:hypothetical protein
MDKLNKKIKLVEYLDKNPLLCNIVIKLKNLVDNHNFSNQEIEEIINQMNLPFSEHMFIMGNFSDLMSLNFIELEGGLKNG